MYTYFFGFVIDIIWIIFFIIGIFYLGVAVFSLFSSPQKPIADGYLKFAVVIPAHNEAGVIADLLISLKNQEYPKECFKIFVLADNCMDRTAEIAFSMGSKVLKRTNSAKQGKGTALSDAFSQIMASDDSFDAFVVIDADNIADRRFLAEINIAMLQGNSAVQGYIDARNPEDTWVSYAHSTWYWITNHITQKGFSDLGIGCRLGGTGFAISKSLINEITWDITTFAEDAEYTMKLTERDVKVSYVPKAVVFDEKPTVFRESVNQRLRWARGIYDVQKKYLSKLLKKGKLADTLRFMSDWLMPLCFSVIMILGFFALMNILDIASFDFADFWTNPVNMVLLGIYLFGMIFSVLAGLVQDKKYSKKIILNFLGFSIYILSWIPIGIFGGIRHTKKVWYHTKHKGG